MPLCRTSAGAFTRIFQYLVRFRVAHFYRNLSSLEVLRRSIHRVSRDCVRIMCKFCAVRFLGNKFWLRVAWHTCVSTLILLRLLKFEPGVQMDCGASGPHIRRASTFRAVRHKPDLSPLRYWPFHVICTRCQACMSIYSMHHHVKKPLSQVGPACHI